MSIADDNDYVSAMMGQMESFVTRTLSNFKKEETEKHNSVLKRISVIENEMSKLNTKIKSMESCECKCRETLLKALETAVYEMSTDESPESPIKKRPIPRETPTPVHNEAKRKTPQQNLIRTIDDCPDGLKEKLLPFYKNEPRAKSDYLSQIQRAFVKYFVASLAPSDVVNSDTAKKLMGCGENFGLWPQNFKSNEIDDFEKYLKDRLKNEKKRLNREKQLSETSVRLSEALAASVSDNIEEDMLVVSAVEQAFMN